jgi:sugar phosphate isomerase/epimerase
MPLLANDAALAHELGAHTILMHFGRSQGSRAERKFLLEQVATIGEEHGVAFGFEANIWSNTGQGSYDDLMEMVDEIGSPGFGVYLHNSYPRAGLPLDQELAVAGDRLVQAMHSSDLTSGRVEINWEKAIPVMKKHFADGAYTFEVNWDRVAASKRIVDEAIAKYW